MPAKPAPSAAPPHALRVWSDGTTLFAEIPGSPPHVLSLLNSEAGLSKILRLLRTRFAEVGPAQVAEPAPAPLVQSVLKRMGMI